MNLYALIGAGAAFVGGLICGVALMWDQVSRIRKFAASLQHQIEWGAEPEAPEDDLPCEAKPIGSLANLAIATLPSNHSASCRAAARDLRERAALLDRDAARYRREADEFDAEASAADGMLRAAE